MALYGPLENKNKTLTHGRHRARATNATRDIRRRNPALKEYKESVTDYGGEFIRDRSRFRPIFTKVYSFVIWNRPAANEIL